jgi:hypothetical protein
MAASFTCHEVVCGFVVSQAQADTSSASGWTDYSTVFLSDEVQDLIRARLPPERDAADGETKKRKLTNLDSTPAPVVDVSWTVCCLDGATFAVAVPEYTRVAEMKRAIGRQREVPHFAFELFVKGQEEPLDDEKRLLSADKVPLFMLQKEASDRLALEALFESTSGADWKKPWKNKDGWMTDADLKDWYGVTVDAAGRVTELELTGNDLAGRIPSAIQQLSALQTLNLGGNELSGPIPEELGKLGALRELCLAGNQLSGHIPPALGQGALTYLSLHDNRLSGPIPEDLGQLGALQRLFLSCNRLTGAIPACLGQLAALTVLQLSANLLSGPIPAELGELWALEKLYLDDNRLSGPIPVELGQLGVLAELTLHDNELNGPVPVDELGQLAALTKLDVASNEISDQDQEQFESYMEEHHPGCMVNRSKSW